MRLFSYKLGNRICVWAQLEEADVADLLCAAGYRRIPCGQEQTPDFEKDDHVVELKCIEDDPLFPNGSLRYIENRDAFAQKLHAMAAGGEGLFKIRFRTGLLLKRAERLLRKAKHQLASYRKEGRCTGVLVVNNASYSIGTVRRMFAAALLKKAKEAGVIDFVVFVNVFAQTVARPRIDVTLLTCSNDPKAQTLANSLGNALKGLPAAIRRASRTTKVRQHRPPVVQITILAKE